MFCMFIFSLCVSHEDSFVSSSIKKDNGSLGKERSSILFQHFYHWGFKYSPPRRNKKAMRNHIYNMGTIDCTALRNISLGQIRWSIKAFIIILINSSKTPSWDDPHDPQKKNNTSGSKNTMVEFNTFLFMRETDFSYFHPFFIKVVSTPSSHPRQLFNIELALCLDLHLHRWRGGKSRFTALENPSWILRRI